MKEFYKKLAIAFTLAVFLCGGKQVAAESCPSTISAPLQSPVGWEKTSAQLKLPFSFARLTPISVECFYKTPAVSYPIPIHKSCKQARTDNGSWKKVVSAHDEHECEGKNCTFTCHG